MRPRLFSIWFFPLVVLLLWLRLVSSADAAPGDFWLVSLPAHSFWAGPFSTGLAADEAAAAEQNAYYSGSASLQMDWTTGCGNSTTGSHTVYGNNQTRVNASLGCFNNGHLAQKMSCTSGQEAYWNGTTAACRAGTCPSGYHLEGSTCVVDEPVCTPETISGPGWYDMGTTPVNPPNAVCVGGCMAIFSGSSIAGRSLVGGIYHYFAPGQYDRINLTCSSGAGLPGTVSAIPADTCGAGQAMGEVNGKTVCVDQTGDPVDPVGTPATSTTTTTETPTTPPTEANPADQSGDGTVVTTRPDGTSVTTTTTTNPTTGVRTITQTETPPDPVSAFCEENPTSPICTDEESSWGGTCAAFSCEGDAIQCAIAREQHTRNCTLFDTPTALSDLGNAGVAGTDSGTTGNPAAESNREVVPFASTLDQTRWLSAASCPAPVSITIMGSPVSFDFSDMCDLLQTIGSVGVAVALIAAVFIVGVF